MPEPHEGEVVLQNTFSSTYAWLEEQSLTGVELETPEGTPFSARVAVAKKRGSDTREPVIRFFQDGEEYARAYKCCWGRYHNCNRTRIGMYCKALDSAVV